MDRPSVRIGYLGAPIASAVSVWVMTLSALLYCRLSAKTWRCWYGWRQEMFWGWGENFKFGLAGRSAPLMCHAHEADVKLGLAFVMTEW